MKVGVLFAIDLCECMAIVTAMDGDDYSEDVHDQDLVMPGFRFHPTEEELIEFYLRRKVEGKRFNIELIAFIDLYHYDPWELPAFATIGEKEWFFYVPRDRKYRNGDRPNRVTTSGYWKATGADRTIWGENSKSIGLKKTLVFYSGKAPKGIRTGWIMNEYRLPPSQTNPKVELSLCRVYKRTVVEDRFHQHGRLSTNLSSFCPKQVCQISSSLGTEFVGNSRMDTTCKVFQLSATSDWPMEPVHGTAAANKLTDTGSRNTDELSTIISPKPLVSLCSNSIIEDGGAQLQETMAVTAAIDEVKKILHYNQNCLIQQIGSFLTVPSHNELLNLETLPNSEHAVEQYKLWE